MTLPLPRVAPDPDMRAVFLRVKNQWANAELRLGDLFSSWRPPGWRDAKVFRVVESLVAEGSLRRREGLDGDVLSITSAGVQRYSDTAALRPIRPDAEPVDVEAREPASIEALVRQYLKEVGRC